MPNFKTIGLLVLEKKKIKGDHLGHVTLIIYINFHYLSLRMLHTMFDCVEKKIFEYYGNIHVYCPGDGGRPAPRVHLFSES